MNLRFSCRSDGIAFVRHRIGAISAAEKSIDRARRDELDLVFVVRARFLFHGCGEELNTVARAFWGFWGDGVRLVKSCGGSLKLSANAGVAGELCL